MWCGVQTCDEFEKHIAEYSVNALFTGRVEQIAGYVAQMAWAFGTDDAEGRETPILPVLGVSPTHPDTKDTLAFILWDHLFVYLDPSEIELNVSLADAIQRHQEFVRDQVVKALLEGQPLAKVVVVAAYRIAVITRARKRKTETDRELWDYLDSKKAA